MEQGFEKQPTKSERDVSIAKGLLREYLSKLESAPSVVNGEKDDTTKEQFLADVEEMRKKVEDAIMKLEKGETAEAIEFLEAEAHNIATSSNPKGKKEIYNKEAQKWLSAAAALKEVR